MLFLLMVYFQQLDFLPLDKSESAAWNVSSEEDGGKTTTEVIKALKQNKGIDVTCFCALQE